ncbi:MAG: hypothetical protein RJB38_1770 [Pseudomonadota bacterium]|jgi:hypothetical protein
MPAYSKTVKIPGQSAQSLYERVSTDIDQLVERWGMTHRMDLIRDPSGRQVTLKSAMVTATLRCSEECLVLDAQLSLLAAPFRGKIDEQIDRWVKKNFPS